METYKFKVEKVGRKWLECRDEYNRIFKVEINDVVKDLLTINNEEICVHGNYENKSNKYGVDRRITNIISEEDYNKIKESEKAKKEIEKKEKAVSTAKSAIERMLYYIEKNIKDYWYKNGENVILDRIAELQELNVDTTEYSTKLSNFKQLFNSNMKKIEEKHITAKKFIDRNYYEENSIVKYNNKYIKIISCKSKTLSRSDVEAIYGGCFADDNYDEYRNAYEYTFEEVSEEEKQEAIIQEEKEMKEKQENELLEKQRESAMQELLDYIYKNSINEEQCDELENNIKNSAQVIQFNKFKSLKLNVFLNVVYLLIENWSDGDCWDYNNCSIGICKTCKITDELSNLIDTYLRLER